MSHRVFAFFAEANTLWISARKGGNMGKPERIKYRLLDVR